MKRGEAGTAETELRFAAELSAAQLSAQASPELESKFVRSVPLDELQAKMLQNEKMAALGRMVSGIAHELNNPLTAIMGYAQLLLSHGLRQDQLVEARRVFEEAERASRIVKNLLYFAREEKPERTRVDVNEIVERALALRSYEPRTPNPFASRCRAIICAPGNPNTSSMAARSGASPPPTT